ncbi:hypothetical protein ACFQZS_06765 [Mucilaginibacter calamicampi]|uniref:VWA domain-containing protein n=1 Tax=Mucilaginibacter calamicampi TaxID=1302352 RepID=A0ABW2YU29_9SPHI
MLLFSITWGAVSGWWAPVCLLLGLAYAWLMYRQPVNLGENFRKGLFALRALAVFIIALLLLSPLLQSLSYQPQKPLILVAQDNSQSVSQFKPAGFDPKAFVTNLATLKDKLGDDYDVREFNFGAQLNNGLANTFDARKTDMSAALRQLNDQYSNQNIGALVIATDGMYNQGADPQYDARNIKSAIYTIALGDTVARRDVLIGNVNYNKTAYLGNNFEIEVLTEAWQSRGEAMRLTVSEGGKVVHSENIEVSNDAFKKISTFQLNAEKKGIHKYNINLSPVKNELSTQNNSETIYVEVLDVKQKILLLYDGPHPDVTVIKQAIESNKNFELKAGLTADMGAIKWSDYSLLILYQPSFSTFTLLRPELAKTRIPIWYMLGAQADIRGFNTQQKLAGVSSNRFDMQEVFAITATDFSSFTLSDSTLQKINKFPPLMAPYANYSVTVPNGVLLKQRIGNVPTSYPLLMFGDDAGRRSGVFMGEGLWRWQLSEYQSYANHHALEELFSQSVQYLTANTDKQRFRAYPSKNIFDEGDNVLLNAELYDDALQLTNTPDVKMAIKSADGKNYNFLFTRMGQTYQLDAGNLPVGEYTYSATTIFGKQAFNGTGQFTVKPLNLEIRQSVANRQLLNSMSAQSGGKMLFPKQLDELAELIKKNENIKTLVFEDKHYSDMIDVKWIFAFIFLLLSVEWFLRKREGEV